MIGIDWDVVEKGFDYAAMDSDLKWHVFDSLPYFDGGEWLPPDDSGLCLTLGSDEVLYCPADLLPEDSLVRRPSSQSAALPASSSAHELLDKAAQAMTDRAKERDAGRERSMKAAVRAFNALTEHDLSERDGWMFMVILKAARACTTEHGTEDDYVDGAAYMALAGESASKK